MSNEKRYKVELIPGVDFFGSARGIRDGLRGVFIHQSQDDLLPFFTELLNNQEEQRLQLAKIAEKVNSNVPVPETLLMQFVLAEDYDEFEAAKVAIQDLIRDWKGAKNGI